MISEARKREKVAAAVSALSFAANAAQSPQSFVRTGSEAAPGTVLMQRWSRKRSEAERNLDAGPVSQSARNRKKKTFREFVEEVHILEGQSREEAEKKRLEKPNPDEWRVRNIGGGNWTTKRKSSLSAQGKRRSQKSNPLTKQELETHAKRTLRKTPSELADIALDREEVSKKKQTAAARRLTRRTGTRHVQDHSQPLQQDKRKPENQKRFERVTPGDVASNLQVTSEPKNLKKGSKPPKKGERGYGTTRSGAIKKRLDKAQTFSNRMDRLISQIRLNK